MVGGISGGYTRGAQVRHGIDGLSALAQHGLGQTPCAGLAIVFRNKAGNRLRLLLWDGNGVWLCHRRLHKSSFDWPKTNAPCFLVSETQCNWLVAGVDWHRLSAVPDAG